MTARLIDSPLAHKQLQAAIAAQPAAAKLSIPRLRDALVNQADVLDALRALVASGALDRMTLRPPVRPIRAKLPFGRRRGQSADGELGRPLFDALVAEGARRGLSVQATSVAVFANKARIYRLRDGETCRRATAERVRAWIGARAAQSAPLPDPPVTVVPPGPGLEPSPAALLREIEAFLASSGISATAFGKAVNGDAALVKGIRDGRDPRHKTIAKIRAMIADWRADPAQVERAPRAPARRDPTQPPETATSGGSPIQPNHGELMDAAERQRVKSQRQFASNRRAAEQAAGDRLDAGQPPRNSFERTAMTHIEQRRADEARAADPVEQAKLALQRKGRSVYAADVAGGLPGHFHVSGLRDGNGRLKDVTPAALIAEAERITGQQFRRAG